MIFQDPYSSLNGRLKVKDIIAEPIKLHDANISSNELNEYINDLLDSVELSKSSAERYPHEFSGGQRQRISIARTLIRNPEVIIFDEATSAVDNKTEQLIQKAIFEIIKERTSIIIAHRLSTIRNCQNIFVLDDGKVIEQGNHDSLINQKDSYYRKLWNIQTGNISES